MSDSIMNISKGAFAEKYRDSASSGLMLLLKANEAETALVDHDTVAALLSATGNTEADATNYGRKTSLTGSITVDDSNDRVDVDFPDQTWTTLGGASNNTLTKLIIANEESASDAGRIPNSQHDFVLTTTGNDVTAQLNASGAMRAA